MFYEQLAEINVTESEIKGQKFDNDDIFARIEIKTSDKKTAWQPGT